MEGDGADGTGMVGEGFDDGPGVGVVDVDLVVARSSGEQWLGRVEGDGEDASGMVGECFSCKIKNIMWSRRNCCCCY